ncbi:hypothetical protein MBLNU457_2381t1 [Dothideomycetes sp. NU457]
MAQHTRTPLRALLQRPPTLRPALYRTFTSTTPRPYHSYEHDEIPPYPSPESTILSAALTHVPTQGFSQEALRSGLRDAGYRDASANLFPRGEFEVVMYHLTTARLGLKNRVQFSEEDNRVGRKVRALVLERLRANSDAGVVGRWQEALGLMSLAGNIPASLKELAALSDEIWFLAGDVAVDSSWYTKRASLASIYAATELYQTTDQSSDMRDTEQFLDRRLEEARVLGSAVGNFTQWAGFQGVAAVNMMRSMGVRI